MERFTRYPPEWICTSAGKLNLARSEFMVRCPYDKSHCVLDKGFSDHLRKCRKNYEFKKGMEGQSPLMVSCRYNMDHKVYAPELTYHEHGCEDKKLVQLEALYFQNAGLLEAIIKLEENGSNNGITNGAVPEQKKRGTYKAKPKVTEKSEEELAKEKEEKANADIIEGLMKEVQAKQESPLGFIGQSPEMNSLADRLMKMVKMHHEPTVVEGVLWADPQIRKDYGFDLVCQQQGAVSQLEDQNAFGYNHRQSMYFKRHGQPKSFPHEKSDDDDWELDSDGPKFDWLSHQHNLKGLTFRYPPGLTKAQRKQFEKQNAERLRCEEGWFVEDYDYES